MPGGAQPNPADRLESEIEAFLRRAANPQDEPVEAVVIDKPSLSDTTRLESPRLGSTLQEGDDQLNVNSMGGGVTRMGRRVAEEVDRMESHVHEVFDHAIGRLKETVPEVTNEMADIDDRGTDSSVWEDVGAKQKRAAVESARRKAEILEMLRSPTNIRQAIIMSEILERPNFD